MSRSAASFTSVFRLNKLSLIAALVIVAGIASAEAATKKVKHVKTAASSCSYLLEKSGMSDEQSHCKDPQHDARTRTLLPEFQQVTQNRVKLGVSTCGGECGVVIFAASEEDSLTWRSWVLNNFRDGGHTQFNGSNGVSAPVCVFKSAEAYDRESRSEYPRCVANEKADARQKAIDDAKDARERKLENARNAVANARERAAIAGWRASGKGRRGYDKHGYKCMFRVLPNGECQEVTITIEGSGGDGGGDVDPRAGMIRGVIPADSANGR